MNNKTIGIDDISTKTKSGRLEYNWRAVVTFTGVSKQYAMQEIAFALNKIEPSERLTVDESTLGDIIVRIKLAFLEKPGYVDGAEGIYIIGGGFYVDADYFERSLRELAKPNAKNSDDLPLIVRDYPAISQEYAEQIGANADVRLYSLPVFNQAKSDLKKRFSGGCSSTQSFC